MSFPSPALHSPHIVCRIYHTPIYRTIFSEALPEAFIDYATAQFNKRIARVEAARGATLEEIYRVTGSAIAAGDA